MNNLKALIILCNSFINKNISLYEFQIELEHFILPDEFERKLNKYQHNTVNSLEKIYYFYPQEEHYERGVEVANKLVDAVKTYL